MFVSEVTILILITKENFPSRKSYGVGVGVGVWYRDSEIFCTLPEGTPACQSLQMTHVDRRLGPWKGNEDS